MTPRVSVCICTFRRPRLLAALLDALVEASAREPDFEVIVVDNDAAGSAAATIASVSAGARIGLRALLEPRQNIALARNRAVRAARAPWIAVIDDDEVPDDGWLGRMLALVDEPRTDGALGPVLPILPPEAPDWVRAGRFFERPRHATGTVVPRDELRTSNIVLRASLLRSDGEEGPFDPRHGLTGGEDSVLLGRLADDGAVFRWCDEAAVREHVPVERARAGYLLARSFGGGHGFARHQLRERGAAAVTRIVARGAGGALVGGALAVANAVLPGTRARARAVKWAALAAAGFGKLAGMTPYDYEHYRAAPPPVDDEAAAPGPRTAAG